MSGLIVDQLIRTSEVRRTDNGLSVTRIGNVLHLILDAPQRRNALSRPMLAALSSALHEMDETVRGAVLSGRDIFSAGGDLRELTGTSSDISYDDAVSEVAEAIRRAPRLVFAALEGPCIGAAADLALACDFRVAAEGSYIHIPAVRLGVLYNPEALARLQDSLSPVAIRRLFLLGERLTGQEALGLGIVSHASKQGEAVSLAAALLEQIPVGGLEAAAATKAFLNRSEKRGLLSHDWQERRRELLDSQVRGQAVAQAKQRFVREEG
ncbi:MAG: enoyl-CoA hydratase/isomerase family protein [Actinomycetota bacterium]